LRAIGVVAAAYVIYAIVMGILNYRRIKKVIALEKKADEIVNKVASMERKLDSIPRKPPSPGTHLSNVRAGLPYE